jgi:hypothetical protein
MNLYDNAVCFRPQRPEQCAWHSMYELNQKGPNARMKS